jgi:hypothetical protein
MPTVTPTLESRFANTHPHFQREIRAIADASNCTRLRVYELWRQYSVCCDNSDQSALLSEFVCWYAKELGADVRALETALMTVDVELGIRSPA